MYIQYTHACKSSMHLICKVTLNMQHSSTDKLINKVVSGGSKKEMAAGQDTLLTNKILLRILLLLSVPFFSLLSLLSLLLYFFLICVLSHASLARSLWPPGAASSSADVPAAAGTRTPVDSQPDVIFFHPLFWDGGCARFTVATVGWCFRSHYDGPLMTLK